MKNGNQLKFEGLWNFAILKWISDIIMIKLSTIIDLPSLIGNSLIFGRTLLMCEWLFYSLTTISLRTMLFRRVNNKFIHTSAQQMSIQTAKNTLITYEYQSILLISTLATGLIILIRRKYTFSVYFFSIIQNAMHHFWLYLCLELCETSRHWNALY